MRRPESTKKTRRPAPPAPPPPPETGLLDRLEMWLSRRQGTLLAVVLIASAFFAFLLFDVKISEGNDDSMYIESGFSFAHDFTGFYTANAPLYPMLLSIPIALFGVNLFALKLLSVVFTLVHLLVFHYSLRKRIPLVVLFPVLTLVGVNSYYLYFASQTYTEAFFLLVQGIFLYCLFNVYDGVVAGRTVREDWKAWSLVGVLYLAMSLTKNVALACIPAVILFFVIDKRYRAAGWFVLFVGFFRGLFEVVRSFVWVRSDQFASQTAILLQKDPYNPAKGQEDVAGFVNRFFGNIDLFVSKRFYQILGFRSADSYTVNSALSLITIVVVVAALITVIRKKQKVLLLTGIYGLAMTGLTFLVLQTRWDQPRYIIVFVHLILLVFFYGLYARTKKHGASAQWTYVLVAVLLVGSSLISTVKKGAANIPTLQHNLAGDKYYGFTEDYINYLKLSRWCADSLPPGSLVAARKAPMSFIYSGGMEFYPIYTASVTDPDSVLALFKREKVTHVILANLRRNPKAADGYIINTVHRMVQPVAARYPEKVQFVKRMGTREPADLFRIVY